MGVKQPYAQLMPLVVIDTVAVAGAACARAIGKSLAGGAIVVVVVGAIVVLVVVLVVVVVVVVVDDSVPVTAVMVLDGAGSAAPAATVHQADAVTASASAVAGVNRRIIVLPGRSEPVWSATASTAPAGLRQRRLRCDTNADQDSFDRAGRSFG
jgi:hypothetical protein